MNDWFRSLTLLGMASAAVVVVTLGLATFIVPSAGDGQAVEPTPSGTAVAAAPGPATSHRPGMVGGTLNVSGDRQGNLVVDEEVTDGRYGLSGDDGMIALEHGEPVTVGYVLYDGLEFFVDPDECSVAPGERHDPSGVAPAEIVCEAIDDVRDNGTIRLEGTVGVAADLFGLRGDLPESGGSIQLGEEILTIGDTRITLGGFRGFGGFGGYVGQLVDSERDLGAAVGLGYEPATHALSIVEVQIDGDVVSITSGCSVKENEIGMLNPHTRVSELVLECAAIDIPSLGVVALRGSVIAELAEPPR